MDNHQLELRGRYLAHAFHDELEEIEKVAAPGTIAWVPTLKAAWKGRKKLWESAKKTKSLKEALKRLGHHTAGGAAIGAVGGGGLGIVTSDPGSTGVGKGLSSAVKGGILGALGGTGIGAIRGRKALRKGLEEAWKRANPQRQLG